MFTNVKAKLDEAKKFAEKHQLVVACSATAIVSVLVTREIDIRIARDFAYRAGQHAGVLEVQNILLREFIEGQGLVDEFLLEFVPAVGAAMKE